MQNENSMYSAEVLCRLGYAARGEVPVRVSLSSRHFGVGAAHDFSASLFDSDDRSLTPLLDSLAGQDDDYDDDEDENEDENAAQPLDGGGESEDDGAIDFVTQGGMKVEDGVMYVRFSDSPESESLIEFDPASPGRIAISRSGGIINSFVLEEGVRCISVYQTPIMPFEAAFIAKKVRARLYERGGGEFDLDYFLELRGADVQRTRMKLKIEPM